MSKIIFCFLLLSSMQANVFGFHEHNILLVPTQEKYNYIKLQISDQNNSSLPKLVDYLKSFENKIIDVIYEEENRYLTIYYTSTISVDNIYELLNQKAIDFIKISGTEL